ncbi:MAG: type IV pilin protein [Gammaproteobacteria bacterium]|nr:type IV pilin protein [Gammaproteobacteria bacterium]
MIKLKNGFTLIELMITCTIIGILILIAITLYTPQVRKGRRSDGLNTLFAMSLAEERYRSNNTTYGTLAQVWGGVTTSTGGYYTLSISNVSATAYTLTAVAQGDQTNDSDSGTNCTTLTLSLSAGTISKTPTNCWPS